MRIGVVVGFLELAALLLATQWPLFILATKIDGDELAKGTLSSISAASAFGAYKLWRSYRKHWREEEASRETHETLDGPADEEELDVAS